MKTVQVLFVIVAVGAGGALGWHRWQQVHPAPTAAAPAPVSAAVSTAAPQWARVPLSVSAYGDLVPAKVESVNFARPGILAALRVVVGQRVRRGEPVAQLGSDPLAEATWRQARSALALAEGELQRLHSLFALQLATASQVQTALKLASDARSNLDAQEKLGGGVTASDADAPFDGVVLALNAAQGDRLAAGAPVLQMGRTDRLKVNLGIEPSQRARVQRGQPVGLVALQSLAASGALASAPEATAAGGQGVVADIQDLVDPKTRLLTVSVDVARAADSLLVPGMRIRGAIQVGEQAGWLVPRSAVLDDDQGGYLFQVATGHAHRVPVTALLEVGEQVLVSGALAADRPVVSVGNYELTDGMQVREARP